MNDRPMITQKQFFILLFVCRISLAIIYSSAVSGIGSVWDMFFPLVISVPLLIIMFLRNNYFLIHLIRPFSELKVRYRIQIPAMPCA